MKELNQNTVSTIDPGKKRKKKKGGTSFNNSKQRRRRELKKKEETCIEGISTPSDSQNTCAVDKGGLDLQSIDEEREDSGSQAQSMAKSEHRNNSHQSGSPEERKKNSIMTVSLSHRLYAQRALQDLGYENKILEIKIPKYGRELGKILTFGFYIILYMCR